jgi:hypothetical protein
MKCVKLILSLYSSISADPLTALMETMLPLYAENSCDIVTRILQLAKEKDEDIPVEDGFELYKELSDIRRIHHEALPACVVAKIPRVVKNMLTFRQR